MLYALLVKGHSLAAWENISLKYPMQVECWAAHVYWPLLSRNCFATNYYGKATLATTRSSDISESSLLPVQLKLQVHHGILVGPSALFRGAHQPSIRAKSLSPAICPGSEAPTQCFSPPLCISILFLSFTDKIDKQTFAVKS